jgi:hypothetical protein
MYMTARMGYVAVTGPITAKIERNNSLKYNSAYFLGYLVLKYFIDALWKIVGFISA